MKSEPSKYFIAIVLICLLACSAVRAQDSAYQWLDKYNPQSTIADRIAPPPDYVRTEVKPGTFGQWLRNLPLKAGTPPVLLFNGDRKRNQNAHFAVIDIDVGRKNLQQCADAVIRLRAEYLYQRKSFGDIHFNFTSGDNAEFSRWIFGHRPQVRGETVRWSRTEPVDSSYTSFRNYLNTVFTYAGSYSLSREMKSVRNIADMKIGDVFIQGGFPGHAVIIVDMAVNPQTGRKVFMLVQSYMPAQEPHILVNPRNSKLSPWYDLDFGETLYTPEWTFRGSDLKSF